MSDIPAQDRAVVRGRRESPAYKLCSISSSSSRIVCTVLHNLWTNFKVIQKCAYSVPDCVLSLSRRAHLADVILAGPRALGCEPRGKVTSEANFSGGLPVPMNWTFGARFRWFRGASGINNNTNEIQTKLDNETARGSKGSIMIRVL